MAAIGSKWAQQLINDAAEVGITPAELGEISGRGEDFLEMMSHKDAECCESEIDNRRERNLARARTAEATRVGQPLATPRQVDFIMTLLRQRGVDGDGGGFFSGPTSREQIQLMTKADASRYITSLKGDY